MRLPRLLLAACGLAAGGCHRPDRIALDPPTVRLFARGQTARVHALPSARNGAPMPEATCAWSSSDPRIVTVTSDHNDATLTAAGPGNAELRCRIGAVEAQTPVAVRFAGRVEVSPARVELKIQDEPQPTALEVRAFDSEGHPLSGRVVTTRCDNEEVCRGDARGQLWAVSPGDSNVTVEVEGATAQVSAHVVDARSAEGRPKKVKGNPMLEIDRALGGKTGR